MVPGDYPTHGAHKGLSRAWWEPNVGQAHALQVWPRSVDVTRTIYSRTNRPAGIPAFFLSAIDGSRGRVVGAGGVCRGDYPTHGAHKGLSRAWWEPNVGQAHALQDPGLGHGPLT